VPCVRTVRENAFAAPVVKHQDERRQTVIDTGVYSVVRHPMYKGSGQYREQIYAKPSILIFQRD
jgi:protein-S-isoprenylcysteine O-methyltransferase Ste14